ncbi:unnamed protein product, partial [Brassica oleracea var. botrytis]
MAPSNSQNPTRFAPSRDFLRVNLGSLSTILLCRGDTVTTLPFSYGNRYFLGLGASVCFSFLIGLPSCVAVSTGLEDAIEITLVVLVDEVWTSTSHYVTILQLFDFAVKALPTHSSTVSNSLSSSVEDLSYLAYLCVVCYAYG